MNKRIALVLSMIALASAGIATNASAQEKTRAEVRQELIQAENDGSRLVTDTSYPEVNPNFAQQVAHSRDTGGMGAVASPTAAAGMPAGATKSAACVGPISFCSLYFGS